MPGETNGLVANGLSLPTMETFAYPVDAVSKGGREKAETYEPLWKIADRHRVLKVPEGREKKKKERKKEKKKKGKKERKKKKNCSLSGTNDTYLYHC